MKRHTQSLGVRKWSGNDLIDLQSEGLSILDNFFGQYGNCIITGCEIVGNSISEGLVNIDGKVLPFWGASEIQTFPVFLERSETHEQREYADGVVRDIAIKHYAQMVLKEPSDSHIKISIEANEKFFDNVNSDILRQFDIPILLAEPTKETLSYLKDSKEYDFWIGQQCRVVNNETQKYTFYQLYDISEGMADWQILGKGDGLGLFEAPTLAEVPKEDTLTYTKKEVEYNFLIGQQCRVINNETQKYTFYQLYDISKGMANWQIVASNGSVSEETVEIILTSNQGIRDTSLLGKVVTVSFLEGEPSLEFVWNGTPLSATIPVAIQYEVSVEGIDGYRFPAPQSFLAIGGNKRQVVFSYSCEKVVITVTANDDTETSARTTTIKHATTNSIIGKGVGSTVIIKVPTDTPYIISVDYLAWFIQPPEQSFTADSVQRNVQFVYNRGVSSSIIFDTSISDPSNITGDVNDGVLATILSKFRRCLCKKIADEEVIIAYLDDNDSTKYDDGTTAILNGDEGDVMVDFPEFYYKYESIDNNKYRYVFAEYNIDGDFKHIQRSLVGAYKAFYMDNKLYSRSGVLPTKEMSFTVFDAAAQARGIGYQMIDFRQHCVVVLMLYAKYGNRNIDSILGTGGVSHTSLSNTGTTNSIGNNDTVNEKTSGKYVNGLGIEGVFASLGEFVKGVIFTDNVWVITDPDGTTRNITASEGGYIKKMAAENGAFFDMVPIEVGGSETTYYTDIYQTYKYEGQSLVITRSGSSPSLSYGIAHIAASLRPSTASWNVGARIAFRGSIIKSSSISSFKELEVI